MNRKQLCNVFATQSKPKGKASALYFVGRVAYSYGTHFPLAVLSTVSKTAYVNEDKYSPTTSRHQSEMRYALGHNGWKIVGEDTEAMKRIAARALYEQDNK